MDENTPGNGIDPLDTAIDVLGDHRKARSKKDAIVLLHSPVSKMLSLVTDQGQYEISD